MLVRKIGVPFDKELAMSAVADGGETVRNEAVIAEMGVDEVAFSEVRAAQIAEIERRRAVYLHGRPRVEVAGRVAIVVDDGIATGATTRAALRAVRALAPRRLVLATPVAPADTLADLAGEADEIVCLRSRCSWARSPSTTTTSASWATIWCAKSWRACPRRPEAQAGESPPSSGVTAPCGRTMPLATAVTPGRVQASRSAASRSNHASARP